MAFKSALARLTLLSLLVSVGSFVPAGCSAPSHTSVDSSSDPTPTFDLRLCALVSACSDTVDMGVGVLCESIQPYRNIIAALGSGLSINPESVLCLRGATTCEEVDACIRNTPAQIAACNGKTTDQCVGDIVVQCGTLAPPFYFYDCAQVGQHCFQGASRAACGTGTCDPGATSPSCQGDSLLRCSDIGTAAEPGGVLFPTDCDKQYGWTVDYEEGDSCASATCTLEYADTCGMAGGVAQCVGTGAACNPSTLVASCSGTVVTACAGGKVAHFDCASIGYQTCKESPTPGYPYCAPAGTDCDRSDETCEDGVISFCLWGTKATMDCKSYGFSGCTTAKSIATTDMAAKCTP